ncbi:lantibiotic dehydratase [Chitinophaga sp. sic0106]|uniref:lantibiotic dehydratase n=1 Tax=Chitinophaga sp. sic0106 TaxID=2854785 RepID=UPI001C46CA4C|nr:lantibiotic dehydratase [Chitinophaga sp. sic0106]MBV7530713.1 lantibiotic dehydratase [Chitinophaga sp. sic0106]
MRTPMLPVSTLQRLQHLDLQMLPSAIREIFADPGLQEAIYIASIDLYQEMQRWRSGQPLAAKEEEKLTFSLYRYLLRMSTRCTPYGLFAGITAGSSHIHSQVLLGEDQLHRKYCRLDMNYVAELTAAVTTVPAIREQLLYFPNNSIYLSGSRFRYAAYTLRNKVRNYYLTAVDNTDYLRQILHTATSGATLEQIRQCLISEENEITWYDADEFVQELLANQLLVSELEPTVTGTEFFHTLIARIQTIPEAADITAQLQQIVQLLQQPGMAAYQEVNRIVKNLLPDTSSKDLLQTDLYLHTTTNHLSEKILGELAAHTNDLAVLARSGISPDLEQFTSAFSARYEEQEVPLSVALDAEAGIGYGAQSGGDHTPLLDELQLPATPEKGSVATDKLLTLQLQRLRENTTEIVLTKAELESLKSDRTPKLPASGYLMGKLLAPDAAALDAGNYRFELHGCNGPSAANLLGRFCHGDAFLSEQVNISLRKEENLNNEVIFAELVHLPESRTGNILMRPRLRPYEIVYLAASEAGEDQIPVSDLMVSIRQGKIRLRSIRHNKWVVPRMSTAHNYRNGLPIYKFLCELQFQDYEPGYSWQWLVGNDFTFLPRVSYGNFILHKRTWIWRKSENTYNRERYKEHIQDFRKKWDLPQYIVISEGDNDLVIDLDSPVAVALLGKIMDRSEQVILQELLQTPDQCWIQGPNGRHANELVLPFHNLSAALDMPPLTLPKADIQRSFHTGSEWLYVKIYCGTRTAEDMLKEVIAPLVADLQENQIIQEWFFIRYTDPEHHLRVRFRNADNPGFWQVTLQRLYEIAHLSVNKNLVSKIQTDTYIREIERYGNDTMAFSESVFHRDSQFVLQLIQLLDDESGEEYRWKIGVVGTDQLLDAFGFSLEQKGTFMQQLQQHFFKEFNGNKALQQQLNDKYRQAAPELTTMLAGQLPEEVIQLLQQRRIALTDIIGQQELPDKFGLLSSYVHMFLNRLLLAAQRKHELVIYHFLDRYYTSMLARAKKTGNVMV